MSQSPAGWYPDPDPRTAGQSQRWWDGTRWTEHVQARYAAPGATAYAGPRTDDGVPLAGWWQRVGGYLIDGVIVTLAATPATIPIQIAMQRRVQPLLDRMNSDARAGRGLDVGRFFHDYLHAAGPLLIWTVLAGLVVSVLYGGLLLRFKGQTVGMMSLGIGVRRVEEDGRLPWSTIARRLFGQLWPNLFLAAVFLPPLLVAGWIVGGLYALLDGLWPLWDRRNQTLHDKLAGTVVVRRH